MRSPTTCEVGGTLLAVTVAMLWTGCLAHQQETTALQSTPTTPLPDRIHNMLPRVHGMRWLVQPSIRPQRVSARPRLEPPAQLHPFLLLRALVLVLPYCSTGTSTA